jgi:hypothetical protein
MIAMLLILAPLVALLAWAAAFDLKRRRRRAHLDGHDVSAAANRVRGRAEGGGATGHS